MLTTEQCKTLKSLGDESIDLEKAREELDERIAEYLKEIQDELTMTEAKQAVELLHYSVEGAFLLDYIRERDRRRKVWEQD